MTPAHDEPLEEQAARAQTNSGYARNGTLFPQVYRAAAPPFASKKFTLHGFFQGQWSYCYVISILFLELYAMEMPMIFPSLDCLVRMDSDDVGIMKRHVLWYGLPERRDAEAAPTSREHAESDCRQVCENGTLDSELSSTTCLGSPISTAWRI